MHGIGIVLESVLPQKTYAVHLLLHSPGKLLDEESTIAEIDFARAEIVRMEARVDRCKTTFKFARTGWSAARLR